MKKFKKVLVVVALCFAVFLVLPIDSSAACSHTSLGQRYSEASHPHAYYKYCNDCGEKVYIGGYETKAHGDGTWGSGTCPSCGSHTYVGLSCTTSGTCACGATKAATGHSLGQRFSEASHPHYYYKNCNTCGAKVYVGGSEIKAHGDGTWGSGTCPSCGSHTYVGLSCTTSGTCTCGATKAATGHTFKLTDSEDSSSDLRCSCGVCIQQWNLVDSGKHVDYSGTSKYLYLFDIGKDVWNKYKSGVIRKDTVLTINDVNVTDMYIADTEDEDFCFARTWTNGSIEINLWYFDQEDLDEAYKLKTVIHELGHTLGIGHGSNSNDVMVQGQYNTTVLSSNDRVSYDAAYERY